MIDTLSLCPKCYKKIQAQIHFVSGQAIMRKECDIHGKFEALVEKDAQHFANFYELGTLGKNNTIILHAYNECNMKCSWCYYPMGVEQVKSAEYFDMILKIYKPTHKLLLSGGEPTIRPDYFDFIFRLNAYGWQVASITNMLKLADEEFFAKTMTPRFIDAGVYKFAMSVQHPKWYSEDILDLKMQALENIRKSGLRAMCVMFSIKTLDELDWIREFYDKYSDTFQMMRIRTMFKNWQNKEDENNLFCSDLHKAFDSKFEDLSPITSRVIEHSNSYCVYLGLDDGMEISLSSSPTVENIDYHLCGRPALMLAMDGKCYPVPTAQIVNEGISLGYKDGFKVNREE